ncbi:myb-related protein 330-like [Ananas comosus]|uniref:Myb-related protein 330-like n=1 Tax=Ananas comosus TaxID=4615 RepID=A0A199UI98_ANACO|nr:myb-related protein 330-like [Ananas comosus]OAY64617.1 Transcription factor RAX3 [Ananas comosus]
MLGLNRCGRSCRSRWLNYLRPGLKIGGFTEEEDRIISSLYNQKGRCWSVIAAQLPGRTDLSIKNYWNCKLSKKVVSSKNKMLTLRPKPDRLPSAPITPSSTETQKPDHLSFSRKPSTSDGLGSKLDTDESAQKTKLLTSSSSGELISESSSSSANVASENLVADAGASALVNTECRPPEFNELVDWCVMSPPRDLVIDYSYSSSIIDGLEDINSSDMLLSDEPWW